ncbi:MAG TPA: hypothetical protein ENI98_09615 [Gammaproteobacteria bacterium]|nr:hypothetical protein [Gammaproteobacteria bacterium]
MKCCNRYLLFIALFFSAAIQAAPVSDIAHTVHNLSASGPGTVTATTESQICVFCHTPHDADQVPAAPLWNRALSGSTYTPYSSASMDAVGLNQPGGSSKLCLSCHDGTLALGAVNVLDGQSNVNIAMSGTSTTGGMPPGSGIQTGFTRDLGTNLTNDHPVSFPYDSTLASADGELRDPALVSHIGNRVAGQSSPLVPLENGELQCVSCHDPHIRDSNSAVNIKFLRLNRFQISSPLGGNFDRNNDIICLACHDKLGQAWAMSAHADQTVADEIYSSTAATQRDFPANIQVWEAGCLNCHDTHTVQGSRRLLREGTDSLATPKSGGNSAIEETCYQCHSSDGSVLLGQGGAGFPVPDIKTDFISIRRMPITNNDQPAGTEVHDITDADFSETTLLLGKGNPQNRHVECTDCHNPHRLMKNQLFNGSAGSSVGTHQHDSTVQHSNIASGVLRGSRGVEPVYGSSAWGSLPSNYIVKQGDGGLGASTTVSSAHVTREYQVCLKCHSDYAYDIPPTLGDAGGGTPSGTNGLLQYTNQAMEFQAPTSDLGEPGGNHRGWHPVLGPTGRTAAIRGTSPAVFLSPFSDGSGTNIGVQTMYCSDCHGSATANGTSEPSGGPDGAPWGPHGSTKDFILKGDWNKGTGTGQQDDLCFKCHNYNDYANPNNSAPNASGFRGASSGGGGMGGGGMCGLSFRSTNLHIGHARKIGSMHCSWCHAAVPHGWKNKALLVDISQEGGRAPYSSAPYYMQAMLGGGGAVNWKSSGNWTSSDCGGVRWMGMSCRNPP